MHISSHILSTQIEIGTQTTLTPPCHQHKNYIHCAALLCYHSCLILQGIIIIPKLISDYIIYILVLAKKIISLHVMIIQFLAGRYYYMSTIVLALTIHINYCLYIFDYISDLLDNSEQVGKVNI